MTDFVNEAITHIKIPQGKQVVFKMTFDYKDENQTDTLGKILMLPKIGRQKFKNIKLKRIL